jgi:hypothetical protein
MNDTEPHARDRRLRQVPWRDLAVLTRWDPVRELLLPLPWLLGSLFLAGRGLYPLATVLSFGFFLTGLRVVHGAFHYTLGLPRLATDCVMLVFSVAMLGSMHAVQWNHLRHHWHCLVAGALETGMVSWRRVRAAAKTPYR